MLEGGQTEKEEPRGGRRGAIAGGRKELVGPRASQGALGAVVDGAGGATRRGCKPWHPLWLLEAATRGVKHPSELLTAGVNGWFHFG